MLSRKTAKLIAKLYRVQFSSLRNFNGTDIRSVVDSSDLYDFLFEREYEAWFCNLVRSVYNPRTLEEFVMRLHTTEPTFRLLK
jgi:hypothetical protein